MSEIEIPILITKDDCQKCEWLKDKIKKEGLVVKILDGGSTEALSEFAYHEMIDKMPLDLPILIYADEQYFAGESMKALKHLRMRKEKSQGF
ncbi:hypothetical protein KAU43_05370 [candidate division WOR-3 bacterium]|nr:hypothetical protein [candidate division WOR-3 bacterium]